MRSPLRRNSLARIRGNVFRSGARLQWWPRPKLPPTAAAGPTASGSITLGGTATAVASAPSTTGTITLGGSPTGTATATSTGSITLGGSPTATARPTASGSITLGGTATGIVPPKFVTLYDSFPTSIDSKWSASSAFWSAGRVIVLADVSPAYGYIITADRYDLTGSAVSAKVSNSTDATTEVLFLLTPDDITQNAAMFSNLNGSLRFRKRVSGVDTDLVAAISYSSTTHKYLRFAESGGAIQFQTSPDTMTWTTQASWTPTWSLTSLYLECAATDPGTSTSSPTFDDVNIAYPVVTGSIALGGSPTASARATTTGTITLGGTPTPSAQAGTTGGITLSGTGTGTPPSGSTATGTILLGGTPTATVPATTTGLITLSGLATAESLTALSHIPGVATLSRAEATAILTGNGAGTATLAYQAGAAVLTANAGTAVLTYQPGTADLIPAAASALVNTT